MSTKREFVKNTDNHIIWIREITGGYKKYFKRNVNDKWSFGCKVVINDEILYNGKFFSSFEYTLKEVEHIIKHKIERGFES